MRTLRLEIKKVTSSPIIWVFVLICLAYNVLIVVNCGTDEYADYVAHVSQSTGVVLGEEFNYNLSALSESEFRAQLAASVSEPDNVFEGYDTGTIAEAYIEVMNLEGKIAEDMRDKYALLQNAVDQKAERGDSLTLYFASSTYARHMSLFGSVMSALSMEGILISLLVTLYTLGYEHLNRTEQVVYSSKTGRRIMLKKFAAACFVVLGVVILISLLTLAMFFTLNRYGNIWESNVSSAFNAIRDIVVGGYRPFVTWHSFTVLSYLLSVVGLSLGIILCFSLLCFIAGTWVRNSYIAFLLVFLITTLCIVFPMLLPNNSYIRFGLALTPIWLWLKQGLWFTDGGADILWRNFETLGVCLSLAVLAVCSALSAIKFKKKELL